MPELKDLLIFELDPDKLRAFREEIGVSQRQIAKMIGSTGPTISNIETGETTNLLMIFGYAKILEALYARKKGYIPAFRKVGTSQFIEE